MLLDYIDKINSALYTRENSVFPLTFSMMKEQSEIYQERDQNMSKMMTHLDLIQKI